MTPLISITLAEINEAHFGRSEATMFDSLPKKTRDGIQENTAVCFISRTGNQLCFVWRNKVVYRPDGSTVVPALMSAKLRLRTGTWSPDMLANYASEVGLNLVGIKRFEQHYKEIQATRGR